MSLIGIDVGSSAVKVAAYRPDATLLAEHRVETTSRHPAPGEWEVDPAEVWEASATAIREVARRDTVRAEPPRAIAISASGREVHLANADGDPLSPCLMAGDARRASAVDRDARELSPERCVALCGHPPERMDPVYRILWWRERGGPEHHARWYLGWHELLTLKLGGRPITDPGLASRWLVYDTSQGTWSEERLARTGLDRERLPEVAPWGTVAATARDRVAASLGLPARLPIAVGGFDTSCAALGAGVKRPGQLGLVCGSWHAGVLPVDRDPAPATVLEAGCSLGAHPGGSGRGLFRLSPNGGVVTAWAERLLGASSDELEEAYGSDPSPVVAVPRLSPAPEGGATAGGRSTTGGALLGLSLATSAAEVLQALAEGAAYELTLALRSLARAGVRVEVIRVTGGGARSGWWLQLLADLTSVPVERARPDAGTLGAAMLAGLAVGDHATVEEATTLAEVGDRYEPNPERATLHARRLDAYEATAARLEQLGRQDGGPGA